MNKSNFGLVVYDELENLGKYSTSIYDVRNVCRHSKIVKYF